MIGPRFLRRGKMDYEDIIITKNDESKESCFENIFNYENEHSQLAKQSTEGLKHIWAKFYQVYIIY